MNVETSVEVGADAVRSVSDEEDHEKTDTAGARLSATELLAHDVVPEHRVLFRVSALLSL